MYTKMVIQEDPGEVLPALEPMGAERVGRVMMVGMVLKRAVHTMAAAVVGLVL